MKRGLLPDSEHTFRVRAVRGNSVSEWSDAVKGRTEKAPEFKCSVWKECPYEVDENLIVVTNIGSYDDWCTIIENTSLPLNIVTSWSIGIFKSKKK